MMPEANSQPPVVGIRNAMRRANATTAATLVDLLMHDILLLLGARCWTTDKRGGRGHPFAALTTEDTAYPVSLDIYRAPPSRGHSGLERNCHLVLPVLRASVYLAGHHVANSSHDFNASSPSSLTILVSLPCPIR